MPEVSLLDQVSNHFKERSRKKKKRKEAERIQGLKETARRMAHPKKVVTLRDQVDDWIWRKAWKAGKKEADKQIKKRKGLQSDAKALKTELEELRTVRQ